MIQSSKVLWGEGLFLRPQHFQRQDAYHEWRLAEVARMLHPYAWGVRRLRVDTDALASGVLRFDELQLALPDGELFNAPGDDELPEPLSLAGLPATANEVVFHAALAPMRSHGGNFSGSGADTALRYAQRNQPAPDWFTAAAEAEISTLRRCLRVLPDTEPRDHLVSLPLCRLRRSATGAFELDLRYVAPCTSVGASPTLLAMLRRLLDILQAKVDALYGFHREPSRHVIEFRSGDIASFWLLHTASSAFARLSHVHHHPQLHPERLYESMLELAGALLTFSKSYTLADLPPYDHAQPALAFGRLDAIVRDLLETVISTRCFSIALEEVKPSFHRARLDSQKLDAATTFYLCVQAAMPLIELVEIVPPRFKVGAPDDVDKLVLSAMSGVRLAHAPQVPAAIPVRPGAAYFAIEPRGPLYERMLQAQSATIYAPAGMPDLSLELFALNA
ncbi:MAG: type VI secretion system baseplate subunit TssK [Burkholderiales bacterium]|nr:type VI secretion system baseplate subunit TssK [Burkholderiales bacterium]